MPAMTTRKEQAPPREKVELCFADAESKLYRTANSQGIENSAYYCAGGVSTTVFG